MVDHKLLQLSVVEAQSILQSHVCLFLLLAMEKQSSQSISAPHYNVARHYRMDRQNDLLPVMPMFCFRAFILTIRGVLCTRGTEKLNFPPDGIDHRKYLVDMTTSDTF
jgi:hypothetical protein